MRHKLTERPLVAVPRAFFNDHEERDLPTPEIIGRKDARYLIALDDPALPELLSDARHYSDGVDDCSPQLIRSARLTVAAIQSAQEAERQARIRKNVLIGMGCSQ